MKWLSYIPILLFLPFGNQSLIPSTSLDWEFKKEVDGIRVFTRDVIDSNLKELKIEMTFENTSLATLMAVLMDTEAYADWLYKCEQAKVVEAGENVESVDYYTFNFPWPLSDRDVYIKSVITQDHSKRELLIESTALPDYAPEEKGMVRIKKHRNTWHFFLPENQPIRLVYMASADPGGQIPDWMVNMVIDRGPTISMQNLRERIKMPKYQNRTFSWLMN